MICIQTRNYLRPRLILLKPNSQRAFGVLNSLFVLPSMGQNRCYIWKAGSNILLTIILFLDFQRLLQEVQAIHNIITVDKQRANLLKNHAWGHVIPTVMGCCDLEALFIAEKGVFEIANFLLDKADIIVDFSDITVVGAVNLLVLRNQSLQKWNVGFLLWGRILPCCVKFYRHRKRNRALKISDMKIIEIPTG